MMEINGGFEDGGLDVSGYSRFLDTMSASAAALERVRTVCILPLSDYNRLAGTEAALAPGEALVWSSGKPYPDETLTIEGCRTLRVADRLKDLPFRFSSSALFVTVYCAVVPDWEDYVSEIDAYVRGLDDPMVSAAIRQYCSFDLPGVGAEEQIAVREAVFDALIEANGSLFFLGIVLSIVFIAAAALIIYYKQLSEGYEDQRRFDIMQKVGMTKREIRSSVNSQVLTVFFAPLLLAGLHLAFAFPFVQKIIRIFGVGNTPLLIATSALCFLAFALFYLFVYRGTARAYYAIVSDGEVRR